MSSGGRVDQISIAGLVPVEWQGTPPPDGPRGARLWKLTTGHATASRAEAVRLAYSAQLLVDRTAARTVVMPGGLLVDTAKITQAQVVDGPKAVRGGGWVRIQWQIVLPDGWAAGVLAA